MSMMRRRHSARNRRTKRGLNAWEIGGSTARLSSAETEEIVPEAQRHPSKETLKKQPGLPAP